MDTALYTSWSKGTTSELGLPQYSANWAMAKRGRFKVFSDRVECGDWVIPASSVKEAVLFEARQWFIPVYILAITTVDKTWQFGFNPWSKVAEHLPFQFRRERVRLRYSRFSIVVRAVLLGYLAYLAWGWWHA
jgi:hypothetical protein